MTALADTPEEAVRARTYRVPRAGWLVVAAKELADHVSSIRFLVVLGVLAIAAGIPLYFATDTLRELASAVSEQRALFLALFLIGEETPFATLRVDTFVGLVAPLLGIALAFDAVNGERARGTLPRLLSQPIHRDDVINGKLAGGLAAIGIGLAAMVALISGFALVRLGIVPSADEFVRLILWTLVTFLYVAMWLAFGLLLSVIVRSAATSALIGFGVWVLVGFFGRAITSLIAGILAPIQYATVEDELRTRAANDLFTRVLPSSLYQETSIVLLNPFATRVSSPSTLSEAIQLANQQAAADVLGRSPVALEQSLLLVVPHIIAMVAITAACFAAAYVLFMRQEVRA